MATLEIKNLHVAIEDKEILKGVNLVINTNEIHAIMGPNGTGKSTLSAAIIWGAEFAPTGVPPPAIRSVFLFRQKAGTKILPSARLHALRGLSGKTKLSFQVESPKI